MPLKFIEMVTTLSQNHYITRMVLLQIDTTYFLQLSGWKMKIFYRVQTIYVYRHT